MDKKEFTSKNFIKWFFITACAFLLICAMIVIIFDPFFHYHKPLKFLKAVLWEKEYQVPGTLDHFDYDAVIAGSSVAENNNNAWFDDNFNCTSIKAIRSYGATQDLCYFINRAYKHQDLKYVFLNLDPSSLTTGTKTTFEETGSPMYLYDNNPLTDVKYLFNKDVIFERIPYMMATSFMKNYDEGTSYNWAQWKSFDEDTVLYHYIQEPDIKPMLPANTYEDNARFNIKTITDIADAHKETTFYIFVPPYSILWWDMSYRSGETDSYLYVEELALKELLTRENIRIYNFQNAEDIIFDLDNYTDSLHFSPDINHYICDCLKDGTYELRDDSEIESSLESVRSYAYSACEYITSTYGDQIKVAVY